MSTTFYLRRLAKTTIWMVMVSSFILLYAQPEAPEIQIQILEVDGVQNAVLSWQQIEGADYYAVYSSSSPYADDWGESLAVVADSVTTYMVPIEEGQNRFFYVTAQQVMALVDGDQFVGEFEIDPFYMSRFLVTQEEYIEIMDDNPSHFADEQGNPVARNLPVESVNWFDAIEYCNRLSIDRGLEPVYSYLHLGTDPDDWYEYDDRWNQQSANHRNLSCNWEANGYRLPTEAEWQHAANAAEHPAPYMYAGSNDINDVAWYNENSNERTNPVGTKQPNSLGIFDMSGNVIEWCWDMYGFEFPSGGDNPTGPEDGPNRMGRGGSWSSFTGSCQVDSRSYGPGRSDLPINRRNNIGLRVVRGHRD